MADEEWAPIEGFKSYAVSSYGRIANLDFDTVLTPRDNSYGYLRVGLRKDGETHDLYIHRLVAAAFLPDYEDHLYIKHKDEDNSNNHVDNLKIRNGKKNGIAKKSPGVKFRRLRVIELDMIFRTIEDCARYLGGDPSSIYKVLRGNRVSHKGYTFEYYFEER